MEIRDYKFREPKDVTRRGLTSYTESKLHPLLFGNTIYRGKHNTNVDVRTDTSLLRRVCFVSILTVIFVPEIPNCRVMGSCELIQPHITIFSSLHVFPSSKRVVHGYFRDT